jgi:hypothetical protein
MIARIEDWRDGHGKPGGRAEVARRLDEAHHEMRAHHNLEAYMDAYVDAAGIQEQRLTPLFRSVAGRTGVVTGNRMHRSGGATAAGLKVRVGNHTFRATGITAYLSVAARWKTRRQWRRMKARARPGFTTARATRSRSMRWSGFRF